MNRSRTFKFRCTPKEIGTWGRVAGKQNLKLAAWIRGLCNAAVCRRDAMKLKGAK